MHLRLVAAALSLCCSDVAAGASSAVVASSSLENARASPPTTLPLQPKPGWATKWRRHLDFTINHACWCATGQGGTSDEAGSGAPPACAAGSKGDPACFLHYEGPEQARRFAEFMVSMNVDSVQLESHPDSGWVTYFPTASGAQPYPSLVAKQQDWLGDTITALRAAQTPNNKTLGVFLYMNVGSSNRYAGLHPEYSYSQYNHTPAFEAGSVICMNAPGEIQNNASVYSFSGGSF
jgi:hypothetical protein